LRDLPRQRMTRQAWRRIERQYAQLHYAWQCGVLSSAALRKALAPLRAYLHRTPPSTVEVRRHRDRILGDMRLALQSSLPACAPEKAHPRLADWPVVRWCRERVAGRSQWHAYSDASRRADRFGRAGVGLGGCLLHGRHLVWRFSVRTGDMTTTEAEVAAAEYLLGEAKRRGITDLTLHVDCQSAVRALRVQGWHAQLAGLHVQWVPRRLNRLADYLAALAINQGYLPAPASVGDGSR